MQDGHGMITMREMADLAGKEVTISEIVRGAYKITAEGWDRGYRWVDEMFEEIVPEYYKCDGWLGNMFINGKIYKTKDGEVKSENSDRFVYVSGYPHIFKPSTKAEFEAQFVPKYIKYVGETSDYRIKDRIYKVVSWKQGNVWVICNLDCGKSYNIYAAGASLCMDSLFYKSNEYTIVTEQEYLEQGKLSLQIGQWYRSKAISKLFAKHTDTYKYDIIWTNGEFESDYSSNDETLSSWTPLTDLSEIQEHLPQSHPDKVKPKEWSVGTYAVVIKDDYLGYNHSLTHKPKMPIGFVGTIGYKYSDSTTAFEEDTYGTFIFEKDLVKWFATKSEAEAFAKELLTPKITVESEMKRLGLAVGDTVKVGNEYVNDGFYRGGSTESIRGERNMTRTIRDGFLHGGILYLDMEGWSPSGRYGIIATAVTKIDSNFKLGPYDVIVDERGVKIGCTYLRKEQVIGFLGEFIDVSSKFGCSSDTICVNNVTITLQIANDLLKFINKH